MDHNYKYIKFTKTLEEVLADKKLLWTSRAVSFGPENTNQPRVNLAISTVGDTRVGFMPAPAPSVGEMTAKGQ